MSAQVPSAETMPAVRMGRPRRNFDLEQVRHLRREGLSLRQIAAQLGLGYGTVRRALLAQFRAPEAAGMAPHPHSPRKVALERSKNDPKIAVEAGMD